MVLSCHQLGNCNKKSHLFQVTYLQGSIHRGTHRMRGVSLGESRGWSGDHRVAVGLRRAHRPQHFPNDAHLAHLAIAKQHQQPHHLTIGLNEVIQICCFVLEHPLIVQRRPLIAGNATTEQLSELTNVLFVRTVLRHTATPLPSHV